MDQFGFLFAAYAAIFVAIVGYVLLMGRRQSQLKAMLEQLEREHLTSPPPEKDENS